MESEPISGSQTTGPVEKVQVVVLPADNLPSMKNNKFMVGTSHNISYVSNFLKTKLKSQIGENDTLSIYINRNFQPTPDQSVLDLFNAFNV